MRGNLGAWLISLGALVGILTVAPRPARAAGVDPSELADPEKIRVETSEARPDSGAEAGAEPAEAAPESGGEAAAGDEPDKQWPTPLPQKMSLGRDEEVRKHLAAKNWAEAAIILKSVLDEKPGSLPTAFELSRALTYLGRREEALQILSQLSGQVEGARREAVIRRLRVLSELFTTNENYQLYQEGVNLLSSGREKSARERFAQVLRKEPGNVAVMLRLGQCLVIEEDDGGAVEQLRAAAKLNPHEPEIQLWLGRALSRVGGHSAEALSTLEAAHRQLPGSELAARWYAEALVAAGKRDRALEILSADVERSPLHLLSLLALANIRGAGIAHDPRVFWEVKKDLQVAISRLPDYGQLRARGPRGSLEHVPYTVDSVRKDIDALLAHVESRIKSEGTE